LAKYRKVLPHDKSQVIYFYSMEGMSMRDIAKKMGISKTKQSYIGTVENIIIYVRQGVPSVDSLTGWHSSYDKKNFSIVPFGVSSLDTQFPNNVKNYVGWVYAANDGLTNPWDSLPS
jgi:hypothetical protein